MSKTQPPAPAALTVAPQQGTALANIIPINGYGDVARLGAAIMKSGWFGKITEFTGEMIAMTMLQERISPVTFKKKYHVMNNGTLAVASRAIVSAFKRLGGKMKLHEVSKEKCDITFSYDGNDLRYCVTLQEFVESGVAVSGSGALKDNWAKFPMDMLYARCCSTAIRKVCPEADDGLYTSEEVADFDAAPAAPREPVKIDPSEVSSRLAASAPEPTPAIPVEAEVVPPAPSAPSPAPAPSAPPQSPDLASELRSDAQPPPDAALCPIDGPYLNVPFADMEPDILAFLLMPDTASRHPELTPAHAAAAQAAARAKGMEA